MYVKDFTHEYKIYLYVYIAYIDFIENIDFYKCICFINIVLCL